MANRRRFLPVLQIFYARKLKERGQGTKNRGKKSEKNILKESNKGNAGIRPPCKKGINLSMKMERSHVVSVIHLAETK